MDELQKIIDMEHQYPKYTGQKDDAIRTEFNMSATSYYQMLNRLLDDEEAVKADPVLFNRLRRLRNGNH